MENIDRISNLPEEILLLILMKVEVKALIRLTSVSKLFKTHITRSDFIYHHKLQATRSDDQFFLPAVNLSHFSVSSGRFHPWKYSSSTGVICLLDFDATNFQLTPILWNPSINRFKLIPPFKEINLFVDTLDCVLFGFGFDHVNNDYKVVMILYCCTNGNNRFHAQAVVYGTKTGSWRAVHQTVPCFLGSYDGETEKSVFVNGVVYWLTHKSPTSTHRDCIMGFDVVREVFNVVELPEMPKDHPMQTGLPQLLPEYIKLSTSPDQKSVAIIVRQRYGNSSSWRWSFWFMTNNSWQQQYTMELGDGITPMEILSDGQIYAWVANGVYSLISIGNKKKETTYFWLPSTLPIITGYTPTLAFLDDHTGYTPTLAFLDDHTGRRKLQDNIPRKNPRSENGSEVKGRNRKKLVTRWDR